jgi:hypothetical protein
MIKKNVVVVFAAFCLATALFMMGSIRSSPGVGDFNPWADMNDDGIVDIYDAILLSNSFGKSGPPLEKAGLLFDSGWIDLSAETSQSYTIAHNLGMSSDEMIIEARSRMPSWNYTYGGASPEIAYSVVQTSDGGYAMAGYRGSSGVEDFWLLKTDSNGVEQWNKTYGGGSADVARCVVQTSDGGYALAGVTWSLATPPYMWLVKTNSTGDMEWSAGFGGPGASEAYSVVQTVDGEYALAGYTKNFGAGLEDWWLVKTDSNGVEEWNRTYGGISVDVARSVVQTNDGGYALAGQYWSFATPVYMWLVKTDSTGVMEWNAPFGGADWSEAYSVVQTSDGGFALAGYTRNLGAVGEDWWLVKTDSTGVEEWNKTYGGGSRDVAFSLVQTSDGGYALAGQSWSFATPVYMWLVKTNSTGDMEWNKEFGTAYWSEAFSVVQTRDGGYAVAGYTRMEELGQQDFWLVRIGVEFGLAWKCFSEDTITIFRAGSDPSWGYVRIQIWRRK